MISILSWLWGNHDSRPRTAPRTVPNYIPAAVQVVEPRTLLTTFFVNNVTDPDTDPTDGSTTLRMAMNAAKSGDTIDFSAGGTFGVNLGKRGSLKAISGSLTISGNGNGVSINGNGANIFDITGGTKVVIDGLTLTGSGAHHLILNTSATTALTVSNNTLTGSQGGAVYSDGVLKSSNNTYSNNSITNGNSDQPFLAKAGGAAIQGTSTVSSQFDNFKNNSVITTSTAKSDITPARIATDADNFGGGAISVGSVAGSVTKLTTLGDSFDSNSAWQGGAVYVATGSYTSTGDSFTNNTATYVNGGAIAFGVAASAVDKLSTSSDIFRNNNATFDYLFPSANGGFPGVFEHVLGYGGAVYAYNSWQSLNDAFSQNSAVFGGAAYLTGTNTINYFYNDTFDTNTATYTPANKTAANPNPSTGLGGGAIFIEPDAIASFQAKLKTTFDHSVFTNNKAYDGGAIANSHNVDASQLAQDLSSVRNFDGIDATQVPIAFGTSQIIANANTFQGNSASDRGGAVFNDSNNTFATLNDTMLQNAAGYQGGSVFNFGVLNMTNDTLTQNSAGNTGGGVLAYQVGIPNRAQSTNSIRNSIIAGNSITTPANGWIDVDGFLQTAQFNVLGVAGNSGVVDRSNDQLTNAGNAIPQPPIYVNTAQHGNILLQADPTIDALNAGDLARVFKVDGTGKPVLQSNFAAATGLKTSAVVLATNSVANQLGGALAHLTAALTASDTVARVDDVTSIYESNNATPTYYTTGFNYGLQLRIGDEIVRVTGITFDSANNDYVLNIVRGQNNSTAVAHDLNQAVNLAYDTKNYTRTVNDAGAYQQQIGRTFVVNSLQDINSGDNSLDFGDSSQGRLTLRQAVAYANSDWFVQESLQTLINGDLSQNVDTIKFDSSLAGQTIDVSRNELQVTSTQNILGQIVDAKGKSLAPVTLIGDGSRVFEIGSSLTVTTATTTQGGGFNSEVQTLTLSGPPSFFTLSFAGQSTAPILSSVTAAQLQNILAKLPGIGTNNNNQPNVKVELISSNGVTTQFRITFQNDLAITNVAQITGAPLTVNAWISDLILNGGLATSGNFNGAIDTSSTIGFGGQVLVNTTGNLSLFRTQLTQNTPGQTTSGGGVANFGTLLSQGNTYTGLTASTSGGAIYSNGTAKSINDTIFQNTAAKGGGIESDALGQLSLLNTTVVGNSSTTLGTGAGVDVNTVNLTTATTTNGNGRVKEVQTVTINGTPAPNASFTLSFNGLTTAAISASADAATLQAALNALNTIKAAGNVTVTKSGTTYTITFGSAGDQPQIISGAIPAEIRNSIVVGNAGSAPQTFDIAGTLSTVITNPQSASTNNVFGTADNFATTALTAANSNNKAGATNTQVFGTATPALDAANGGPTPTLDLVNTSVALNAGTGTVSTLSANLLGLDTANTVSVSDLTFLGAGPRAAYDSTARTAVYPGQYIRIDNEIVLITGINTAGGQKTLDIQRAQLGTQLAAHASGATIALATDQRGVIRGVNDAGSYSYNLPRTIIVDNAGDFIGADGSPGKMTLRAAIKQANIDNSGDVIKFSSAVFGSGPGKANTISLSIDTVQLNITGSENIVAMDETGAVIVGLTVSTSKLSRIFNLSGAAVLGRNAPVVTITGLTIAGGTNSTASAGDGFGGAIFEDAEYNLTLTNDTLKFNSADNGGAIYTKGVLTTSHSTFDSNKAGTGAGGAIDAFNTVTSSFDTFTNNQATSGAGGAWNIGASFTIDTDTFGSNSGAFGGAINFFAGTANIVRSTFASNTASTGSGGALFNASSTGSLTLTNTTLVGNTAAGSGGAIQDGAGSTLISVNDTISGNTATAGGGILAGGKETLINDIVVGNTAGNDAEISQAVESAISNIIGLPGSSGITNGGVANNLINQTLANVLQTSGGKPVLASNGGATQTVALANGSPALGHTQPLAVTTNLLPATATTFTNATVLPFNVGEYYLIDQEVVKVTAIAGNTYTLLRGQLGTVAADHAAQKFFNLYDSANGVNRVLGDAGAYQATSTINNTFSRTFVVDENSDLVDGNYSPGHLSLREAVLLANADTGSDLITFAPTLTNKTIRLSQGELAIKNSVTIDGSTATNLTILQTTNDNHSRVFDLAGATGNAQVTVKSLTIGGGGTRAAGGSGNDGKGGAFYVANNYQLTLTNDTISGDSADTGGAIYNDGGLISTNVIYSGNSATLGAGGAIAGIGSTSSTQDTFDTNTATGNGGAIAAGNSLTLSNDTFKSNSSASGNGGAVYSDSPAITLTSQTDSFTNNKAVNGGAFYLAAGNWNSTRDTFTTNTASGSGGAIDVNGGTATFVNLTLTNNTANTAGGGLAVGAAGNVSMTNEKLTGNQAGQGGGIDNAGTLTTGPGTISNNTATTGAGGGINSTGVLRSNNETISGNSAKTTGGGANIAAGKATFIGDAITGNKSGTDGAGLATLATASTAIVNSTVANNIATGNGGGFAVAANGTLTAWDVTVAGNSAANGGGLSTDGTTNLLNDIIAGNKATTAFADVRGTITNATFTLIGDATSAGGLTDGVNNNLVGRTTASIFKVDGSGNPLLATNGGAATQSIQLASASPASSAGGVLANTTSALTADTSNVTLTVDNIQFFTVGLVIRVDAENMLITNINTATKTLTLVRAQSGTGLNAHTSGSPVVLAFDQINQTRINSDLGALLQGAGSTTTKSQTLLVDITADTNDGNLTPGHVSLRNAINQANKDAATPGIVDTIKFSASLAGKTITLNGSEIAIKGSMIIDTSGVTGIVLSAGNQSRIFNIDDGNSAAASTVTIKGLTFTNANTTLSGGAIFNAESLTLSNDTFTNNQASNGGAVYTKGALTSSNDTFTGNSATILGGAIDFVGIGHTSTKDSFNNNSAPNGGALYVTAGAQVLLTTDTLTANKATNNGGAILSFGDLTLTGGSVVSGNSAASGGGILSNFNLTSDHSTISGNKASAGGGGLLNAGTFNSSFDTISTNVAQSNGGGVLNQGTMTALNDTISGNRLDAGTSGIAATNGGGIFNSGTLNLGKPANGALPPVNGLNTIANNTASSGAGIYNQNQLFSIGNSFQGNTASPASPTGSALGGAIYNSGIASSTGDAIFNNSSTNQAGGLYNTGSFTGANDTFSGNQAINPSSAVVTQGGAAYNSGTLNLSNTQLTTNTATQGGGVYNASQFNSSNNTFLNNNVTQGGGGLYNVGIVVSTTDAFKGNVAGFAGGAIYNTSNFTGQTDTLIGNTANGAASLGFGGGAIYNQGTVRLGASEVDNNTASVGGAILTTSQFNSSGNTFARNRANSGNGGAVSNSGSFFAVNDTYFGNTASSFGGAIANSSNFTASNLTITANTALSAGGIYALGNDRITNSIVAGNTATATGRGAGAMDFQGNIELAKNDLFGTLVGGTGVTNGVNGNIAGKTVSQIFLVDGNGIPILANNGGPVQTVALSATSVAIDAGDNAQIIVDPVTGQPVTVDATGRLRIVRKTASLATVDIGAYEVQ